MDRSGSQEPLIWKRSSLCHVMASSISLASTCLASTQTCFSSNQPVSAIPTVATGWVQRKWHRTALQQHAQQKQMINDIRKFACFDCSIVCEIVVFTIEVDGNRCVLHYADKFSVISRTVTVTDRILLRAICQYISDDLRR